MQCEAHTRGLRVADAWRTRALYDAHDALESSLAMLAALRDKLRDSRLRGSGDAELCAQLQRVLHDTRANAMVCLRLFSERRVLEQYKGMTSAATLYAAGRAPAQRVLAFVQMIKVAVDESLPLSFVLTSGRVLQRIDAAAASQFVHACVSELLDRANESTSRGATEAMNALARSSGASPRDELARALALEVDCSYAAGTREAASLLFSSRATQLRPLVGEAVLSQLAEYAQRRRRDALLERACEALRHAQQTNMTQMPGDDGCVSAAMPSCRAVTSTALTTATSTEVTTAATVTATRASTAPRARWQRLLAFVNTLLLQPRRGGWRYGVGCAVLIALLLSLTACLLRLRMVRVLSSLRAATSLSRGAPPRRALTL